MRREYFHLIIVLLFTFNALIVNAEERNLLDKIDLDIYFETYFDNRENAGNEDLESRSGTDFAAKLTPTVSYNFYGKHSLVGGVNWVIPFGELGNSGGLASTPYFHKVMPVIYYKLKSDSWMVAAGLFPSYETMIDSYSTAFFKDDYLFYDNIVCGVMGRHDWTPRHTYIEVIGWWQSQPSEETREIFKLLSSARKGFNKGGDSGFYMGYNFALTHYAGQEVEGLDGVVDNALINPYVGFKVNGKFEFDVRVGGLISMQRDRSYDNEWLIPSKVEAGFKLSRWGVSLDERFYYGDDIMPLYDGHDGIYYADALYTGDPFFRSNGVYNRAELSYKRNFAKDRVMVDVGFVTHLYEGAFNTEQRVRLTLFLNMF